MLSLTLTACAMHAATTARINTVVIIIVILFNLFIMTSDEVRVCYVFSFDIAKVRIVFDNNKYFLHIF